MGGRPRGAGRLCMGSAILALALGGCAPGMTVDSVPPVAGVPFAMGAQLAPLAFDHGSIDVRPGSQIAGYRDGIDCTDGGRELFLPRGDELSRAIRFDALFNESFAAAGYSVVGSTKALFGRAPQGETEARYVVAAQIEDIRANLCRTVDLLTQKDRGTEYGRVSIRVYWQVLDPLRRKVVLDARSRGGQSIDHPIPDALTTLISDAFANAAEGFADDESLRALVTAPPPSARDLMARRSGDRRDITALALFTSPLNTHAEDVRRAVVTVEAGTGHGSGVIIAPDLVLTNYHVIAGQPVVRIVANTGTSVFGDIERFDEARDVALVRIERRGWPTLPIRKAPLRIAEPIFAIGTPLQLRLPGTVTQGTVSAFRESEHHLPLIQADAVIHPGSSGGALVDEAGNLVGIAAAYYSSKATPQATALSLFIPIESALDALDLRSRETAPERGP